jgi:hypothetical protein
MSDSSCSINLFPCTKKSLLAFVLSRSGSTLNDDRPYLPAFSTAEIWTKVHASALLFLQWRIGFIRRRLGFGTLGFAQRSFLVLLSLFLLAPSTC